MNLLRTQSRLDPPVPRFFSSCLLMSSHVSSYLLLISSLHIYSSYSLAISPPHIFSYALYPYLRISSYLHDLLVRPNNLLFRTLLFSSQILLQRSTAIKAILRGKANCCWQMVIKNEKRTVKDEEVFIDDRSLIFGNGTS